MFSQVRILQECFLVDSFLTFSVVSATPFLILPVRLMFSQVSVCPWGGGGLVCLIPGPFWGEVCLVPGPLPGGGYIWSQVSSGRGWVCSGGRYTREMGIPEEGQVYQGVNIPETAVCHPHGSCASTNAKDFAHQIIRYQYNDILPLKILLSTTAQSVTKHLLQCAMKVFFLYP